MDKLKCPSCGRTVAARRESGEQTCLCPDCQLSIGMPEEDLPPDTLLDPIPANPKTPNRRSWSKIRRIYCKAILCLSILLVLSCTSLFLALQFDSNFLGVGALPMMFLLLPWLGFSKSFLILAALILTSLVPCVVYGHIAYRDVLKDALFVCGKREAKRDLKYGYLALITFIVLAAVATPALIGSKTWVRNKECQNNLKQWFTAFALYADENALHFFPELSVQKGNLIFANKPQGTSGLFPNFFNDLVTLYCTSAREYTKLVRALPDSPLPDFDPQPFIDKSTYFYLGYLVTNDMEMRAFAEACKTRIEQGLPFNTDLEVPQGTGSFGGNRILRLHTPETLARLLGKAVLEPGELGRIPVMWDRCTWAPGEKRPHLFHRSGINVVYLDGHVEFLSLDSTKWPLTEETMRLLFELENL